MSSWIHHWDEPTRLEDVGGKALNLARMAADGLPVPPAFTVNTAAFKAFVKAADLDLSALAQVKAGDVAAARQKGAQVRQRLRSVRMPRVVEDAIVGAWRSLGAEHAYAVRSSATLEDLPEASFAGQQDTYLNVRGQAQIVRRVRDCWASLFTDRAILYRRQHGFDDLGASLAVVVQRLVEPTVSGILFTADPVSENREICSIDASYGLGEALVSGLVDADLVRVHKASGRELEVRMGNKAQAIWPATEGTVTRSVPAPKRDKRALSQAQVAELVELGKRVERAQGAPQDIEWCFDDGQLWLLQTRAITSLYPLAEPRPDDSGLHVYLSFGHLQVMTQPIRPFAVSFFQYAAPFGRQLRSELVTTAGGRIFFDATAALRTFPFSVVLPNVLRLMDTQMARLIAVVTARPEFARRGPRARRLRMLRLFLWPVLRGLVRNLMRRRPQRARAELVAKLQSHMERSRARLLRCAAGSERLREAIRLSVEFFPRLIPTFFPLVLTGVLSWRAIERRRPDGMSKERVEALTRAFDGNATTQMDLELGDLADVARGINGFVEALATRSGPECMEGLRGYPDSGAFFQAWDHFIARYGHRCPGEIDLTQERWREDPTSLVRSLVELGRSERKPGLHRAQHARLKREAEQVALELVRGAPWWRRRRTQKAARRVREYLALREHGKYYALMFFDDVRRAALEAGGQAVAAGQLERVEDIWYLHFDELIELLDKGGDRRALVAERRAHYARFARLRLPRVLSSDGEIPQLPVPKDLPPGALAGLGASSGVVEGTARVVLDPARDPLEDGEILIAPFTDPGWTPLFVHASALVMEVGGLMTHGSVVAREYGIPAVVGVDDCTRKIKSGQRVRVDGGRGLVRVLEST